MHAAVGDKLIIKGHHVGDHDRVGLVREIHGTGGQPPYVIEWSDEPGEHTFWPGSDASVEHFEQDTATTPPATPTHG